MRRARATSRIAPAPATGQSARSPELARSFEELGRRFGFSPAQLRLSAWKRDEHEAFCQAFGGSLLWAAERDESFYSHSRARAALKAGREDES